MTEPTLTTVCCDTTTQALWLLLGSGMIVGGLLYVRILIRRLIFTRR